jgi:hypothetical protein
MADAESLGEVLRDEMLSRLEPPMKHIGKH